MLKRPVTYVLLTGVMVQDRKFTSSPLCMCGFSCPSGRLTQTDTFQLYSSGGNKNLQHQCNRIVLQQTPLHRNWHQLVAAAVLCFKQELSMQRKQGRMKAMRSSHIFTSACLRVHKTPSKFPFQPLDSHFGKNKFEDAMAIKDKIEGQTELTPNQKIHYLVFLNISL